MQHSTKGEVAYQSLREAILNGRLRPGQKVTIAGLAQELGVSPMPVREALSRLNREGLVILTPHTETVVAPFAVEDVREIFAVRASLEALAARTAAERITDEVIAKLSEHQSEMFRCWQDKDFIAFSSHNREFHEVIFRAAGNTQLHRFLEEVWAQSYRFRAGYRIIPGRANSAYAEHEVILAALRMNRPNLVELAMRVHIESAGNDLIALIESGDTAWSDVEGTA